MGLHPEDFHMKTTLITGANRGIGLEFARQLKDKGYYVIGCCRDPEQATELKEIASEVFTLDVTNDDEIYQLVKNLNQRPIDLVINNAGLIGESGVTVGNINRDNFLHVFNVNCIGTLKVSEALLPNLQASKDKNILVITSQIGSISDNSSGRSYAYRTSKAAVNCSMRSFAIDVQPLGIHVMLVHPGWVKTELGGENALIDAQTSVRAMLEQAELHLPSSHAEVMRRFDGGTIGW